MKSTFFIPVFVLSATTASFAQTGKATLKGHLQNSKTLTNMNNMKVTIFDLNVFTTSDGDGNFTLSEVPFGRHTLVISGYGAKGDTLSVDVNNTITDMANVAVTPDNKEVAIENLEIPTITVDDNGDESSSSSDGQSSSGFFPAGQDPFLTASSYSWGQYYFKARGMNNSEVMINGISTDDLEKGYSNYSQLSGYYDVAYNRDVAYGLIPSPYTYGGTNGSVYVNATAADQRKGTSVVYSRTNRTYKNRLTVTNSSGLMANGWAYSLSATRRWSTEGYIPGTFFDGYNFYAGASKVVKKGTFSLTAMAAPTQRGKAQTSTDEAFQLTGDNYYNPAWGYQNGEKRNSRVADVFQPLIIANYNYTPTDHTRWTTSVGYEFGKSKNSQIDRYNAYSERGDYYRNLPSYYLDAQATSTEISNAIKTQLSTHPEQLQLDWDGFYNSNYTNYETIYNVNGVAGNNVTGRRSMYVLTNLVDDIRKFSFNTNIEHRINTKFTIDGGLRFTSQDNQNYKELADLLGGDYYLNYNQFANQHTLNNPNYSQNDLNHPNKIIKVGDKYAYDYIQRVKQGDGWAQLVFGNQQMDMFVAGDLGYSSLSREGLMKNGLFPEHSYGKSEAHNFLTYRGKAGISFKVDMRNTLYVNADYSTETPTIANTYVSAATRDFVVDNPTTVKYKTMEAGYILRSPIVSVRISAYATDVSDFTQIKRFYNDDPGTQSFVSYVMNGINIRSTGVEAAALVKINPEWNVVGVVALGQAFYSNTPTASVYEDNDPTVAVKSHPIYINNYYLGVGPQNVYNLSINYTPAKRWFVSAYFNYFNKNYIEIYPERRTPLALDLVSPDRQAAIIDQEKLPAAYTVDIRGGYSFDIHRVIKSISSSTRMFINAGINNILNNQNFKVTGSEQLRYDFVARNPDKFANRYIYAQGINYYITLGLRF